MYSKWDLSYIIYLLESGFKTSDLYICLILLHEYAINSQ